MIDVLLEDGGKWAGIYSVTWSFAVEARSGTMTAASVVGGSAREACREPAGGRGSEEFPVPW
jgi:hypothetical protein